MYSGNGNSGFGGAIGGSTMSIDDDGTTITVTFTKGTGGFNDTMVMYISNGESGRSTIDGNVNDTNDPNRRGISNIGSSDISFPSGFEATHAVAINTNFGGLWKIPNSGSIGSNGLDFVAGVGQPSNSSDASFSFSFEWGEIDLTNTGKFDFVITYGNPNDSSDTIMFSSDEAYGDGIGSGNPGTSNMSYTSSKSYPNTWLGTDTDWSNSSNWTEGSPTSTENIYIATSPNDPIATTAITFNKGVVAAGASLTTQNTLTGNLILHSTSTAFSSLIATSTITGTVTYNRFVNTTPNNDLISAPVSGQTFTDFRTADSNANQTALHADAGNTTFLFGPFDKTSGAFVTYDTSTSATLSAGTGYRAATDAGSTLAFTGTVETGDVDVDIVSSGAQFTIWNLIGNPFTAYINVADFLNQEAEIGGNPTLDNIDLLDDNAQAIYAWNGSSYDIYNLSSGSTKYIAPGQGFFVGADPNDVAGYDIKFSPSLRVVRSDDDFVPNTNDLLTFLKLRAFTANNTYSTEFYFNQNASLGFDPGYDAVVFGGNAPTSFALYSHLVQENTGLPFGLQSLGNSDISNVTIPLGVNANAGEQLIFTIEEMQLPDSINVYLEDTEENSITLLNSTDYILTPSSNISGTGRFYITYTNTTLSAAEQAFDKLSVIANNSNKTIDITGALEVSTELRLFDIQGRQLLTNVLDTSKSSQYIDVKHLNAGIYIVQLTQNAKKKTVKIILK
ncbi:MAG: hypothetical protein Wins2KO_26910 [Winogradskyella sp.]